MCVCVCVCARALSVKMYACAGAPCIAQSVACLYISSLQNAFSIECVFNVPCIAQSVARLYIHVMSAYMYIYVCMYVCR